jgi:tetratricopeptide (TPR) repeat protein
MIEQPDNLPDDQIEVWQQAVEYFERAYRMQIQGDFASAIRDYQLSIRLFPTAEAHTFLGWVYSFLNLYDEAIAECERAIAVDPTFGNSYNDIGAYLIELDRAAEAIPWLEKAVLAPRYSARVYALFNLGRAYEWLGDWPQAITHFQRAARHDPTYRHAHHAAHRLQARLN